MLNNMLDIVTALAQSPLAVFFGMIALIVGVTVAIVAMLRLMTIEENFS